MNKATKSGIGVGIVILLVTGWLTFSPYWTLSRMRSAVQANDPVALNGYIDYPALRENLKSDMAAAAATEISKRGGSPALGAMAMAFVGPMIDMVVQPSSMAAMLAGRSTRGTAPKGRILGDDVTVTRNSLTRFTVGSRDARSKGAGIVLEMEGLGWRMTRIALPTGG